MHRLQLVKNQIQCCKDIIDLLNKIELGGVYNSWAIAEKERLLRLQIDLEKNEIFWSTIVMNYPARDIQVVKDRDSIKYARNKLAQIDEDLKGCMDFEKYLLEMASEMMLSPEQRQELLTLQIDIQGLKFSYESWEKSLASKTQTSLKNCVDSIPSRISYTESYPAYNVPLLNSTSIISSDHQTGFISNDWTRSGNILVYSFIFIGFILVFYFATMALISI